MRCKSYGMESTRQAPIKLRLRVSFYNIFRLENLFAFQKISLFYEDTKIHSLTNKEASTVLCSVVKHAGSGRARKKCRGKHET